MTEVMPGHFETLSAVFCHMGEWNTKPIVRILLSST